MKVAFLDRDGVINRNVGYLYRIEDFVFENGAIDGLQQLIALGFSIAIITNQSGMARGYYTLQDYEKLTRWMREALLRHGIPVLDVVHCPHYPQGSVEDLAIDCDCRKPRPGMIETVLARFSARREDCVLVGDNLTDIQAGAAADIRCLFLVGNEIGPSTALPLGCLRMENLKAVSDYLAVQRGE